MLAPTKKHPTSGDIEVLVREDGIKRFRLPKEKAKGLVLLLSEFRIKNHHSMRGGDAVPSDKVFRELDAKFGRAGAALQGARLKEGFTQVGLAQQLKISQTDLSKMEHGKRTIGKQMAHRLATALKVDYRIFL